MRQPTYKVSTWDYERRRWRAYARTRKWGLRKVLRGLYRYGWDAVSIRVERREPRQ